MQDVNFEIKYEPGKDEADPLNFLSRHPLPIIGNNDAEKILKVTIETEHTVVLDKTGKNKPRWIFAETE